jgi:hypothetical protein
MMEKVLFVAKSKSVVEKYYKDGPYAFLDFDNVRLRHEMDPDIFIPILGFCASTKSGTSFRVPENSILTNPVRIGIILIDHSDLTTLTEREDLNEMWSRLDKLLLMIGRNTFHPYMVLTNEQNLTVDMCDIRHVVGPHSHLLSYREGLLREIVLDHKNCTVSR